MWGPRKRNVGRSVSENIPTLGFEVPTYWLLCIPTFCGLRVLQCCLGSLEILSRGTEPAGHDASAAVEPNVNPAGGRAHDMSYCRGLKNYPYHGSMLLIRLKYSTPQILLKILSTVCLAPTLGFHIDLESVSSLLRVMI